MSTLHEHKPRVIAESEYKYSAPGLVGRRRASSSFSSVLKTIAVFTLVFVMMGAVASVLGLLLSTWSVGWFVAWSAAALALNLATYFFSDKLILWTYHVRMVTPQEAPLLHAVVDEVSRDAGLPKPRVGIVDEASPNAFATGRNPNHAVVVCTSGLLSIMKPDELRGVVAHEMSHVRNRDTLVMTAVASVAAFFAYAVQFAGTAAASRQRGPGAAIAIWLLSYIGGMIAALLIQAFVSRRREYKADETGARLVGESGGLSSALLKLGEATRRVPMKTAHEASSHLFIANPWGSTRGLFLSHPPIEKRVERLRGLRV